MAVDVLTLNKREKELQTDVCELEWPDDATEQYSILKLIQDFMGETETSRNRTASIIGWPESTLRDRQTRFSRSEGERLAAAAKRGAPNTQLAKAQRMVKANPEAFLDDPATARKVAAAMVDNPTAARIVEAAFEAPELAPTNGRSRGAVEAQAPGELLLLEFHAWYIRGKRLLKVAQEAGKLNKRGREDLEETAELARTMIDLLVTVATSGGWDEELAALIEEGA